MDENTVLTPQEVADKLKITKNTVYEMIKRGELNSYRAGKKIRIDNNEVEKYKNRTKRSQNDSQYIAQNNSPLPVVASKASSGSGFVICGQDILLDILARHLEAPPFGINALRSYVGSYSGLYSLYMGEAQVATAHLWDGDTGQYNIPYVRKMVPGVPAVIVHLACRIQGFYVQKGNPRSILRWEDLKRSDIALVNREKGSGTRVLLDEHMRLMQISPSSIKGYHNEKTSHLAVASAVSRGEGDFGMGNEKSAQQVAGIDFVALQTERYELVIRKDDINKPSYQAVLSILRSPGFKNELEGIGGYNLSEIGKIIAET